ncbi:hypothetical protein CJO66_21710 [Burkholderia ubonensis]|uniref:restriction endonuclease subunit S n=1 Tax=Burkholderia ubonensis TaxID=101571 RepID=UPI000BA6D4F4|nr:restriction endonuclease subunit S [Burkholderia ubonensis]PAK12951.1 hypothetical protein CJO66_21710 [Burkholderia ubonensis]RQP95724.1 restriction endonuclease subunit S [Burkholderia ubonensis]
MKASETTEIRELISKVSCWNPTASKDEGTFTYIDLSAIDQDRKVINGARNIPCAEAPSRARQIVQTGDILVSTVRPNLNGVAVVPDELHEATASTGFCVLRPRSELLDGRYLFHWVKGTAFVQDMVKKATGASYPAVSDRIVQSSTLPLPPIEEQRRIAAILDKADELRAKRKNTLALLGSMAQSIFFDMFGMPEKPAAGVEAVPLSQLCLRITDGTHQSPKWSNSGVPFLFVSNIISGEIDFETRKFIDEATHHELTRRCPIECGDVLYSTVGSYGVPAIVRESKKFAFQRHIAHLKPNPSLLDPEFLCVMLASQSLKRQADQVARGVAQKTINLSEIGKYVVLKAPMQMQLQFSSIIRKINEEKRLALTALDEANNFFASLQCQAFRGEL